MKTSILIYLLVSSSLWASFQPEQSQQPLLKSQATIIPLPKAHEVGEALVQLYRSDFAKRGQQLDIFFDWHDSSLNASASYDERDWPRITIAGGLVVHPLLDDTTLALVLCHEIGHFLGGLPKQMRGSSGKPSWSTAEGQADYFAAAQCLKRYLLQPEQKRSNLQEIMVNASLNLARVYAESRSYSGKLSTQEASSNRTYQTILTHPDPQCRLDTMLAAIRCQRSLDIDFSSPDAGDHSCPDSKFSRPVCWFSPE